jgi:hypothetical protein
VDADCRRGALGHTGICTVNRRLLAYFAGDEYLGGKSIPMNNDETLLRPLSAEDRAILGKLKNNAWMTLLKLYVPLFFLLVAVYIKMQPGGVFRGHSLSYSKNQFRTVFPIFAAFFALVFLIFLIKDFRRLILPFINEAKVDKKVCRCFQARKYHDPIYDKRLLFYPDKDNYYIQVCLEDFEATASGEELHLEVASITGEVLSLKSAGRIFTEPAEFSFSDL